MMSDNGKLVIYKNHEFGDLEILVEGDKILFPAKECAEILGYSNPRKAIIDHCKGVTKRDSLSNGGSQAKNYVPEGDLYRLIIRSKLESAQKFETLVFDEIIPSIRKHGMYLTPEALHTALTDPKHLATILLELDKEQKKRQELENENEQLSVKVSYLDKILQSTEAVQVTKISKDYGLSGVAFNRLLYKLGIHYRLGNTWVLYQKYADKGYTHSRTHAVSESESVTQTSWNQKGRKFLYEFLKERGIIPLIEQE